VPTAAAISNALAALVGRPVRQLPMTAERVWDALNDADQEGAAS
jgi:CO/xanthine dehydrogenase Mo-binding subunit